MKNVFDEMTLNKLTLKNRLFRSATWVALADDEGNLTEEIFDTYRELAKGGVAHNFFLSKFISPMYNMRNDEYGGLNIHDCITACKVMQAHGVDAIEISGNYTSREARAGANEG